MLLSYCRKLQPPEQGARALPTTDDRQTDRQTTDGRAITYYAYSERERESTFATKQVSNSAFTVCVTLVDSLRAIEIEKCKKDIAEIRQQMYTAQKKSLDYAMLR